MATRLRAALPIACVAIVVSLAGCQVVQPPPAPSSPAATASPTVAGRTPSPSPSPTPRPEELAIAAFLERVQSGTLTFAATFKGRTSGAANLLRTSGSLAVAGRDYNLAVDFAIFGGTTRVAHRYTGGRAWLRVARGRWSRFPNFLAEQAMSPFAAIVDDTDVTFLRTQAARGDAPQRYRVEIPTGFFHPLLIPAGNLNSTQVDRGEIELVIEANGVPVSGHSRLFGRGRVDGQLQEILIETDITFRRVGSRIVVRAP